MEKPNWCPMAEQAISLIYRLAEHPDVICADVIKKQAAALLPTKPELHGGCEFYTVSLCKLGTLCNHRLLCYPNIIWINGYLSLVT